MSAGYLLDTSFVSVLGDPGRPQHFVVRRWFNSSPAGRMYLCTIVVGELARGVEASPAGRKRREREHWLHHTLLPAFPVLSFDLGCALRWGTIMGEGQRAGRTPPVDDAKIAAVAAVHGLTVVTLNPRDFQPLGVPYLDPTQP